MATTEKICRRGGMVDAPDLKSVDFTVVPVRVRPTALFLGPAGELDRFGADLPNSQNYR